MIKYCKSCGYAIPEDAKRCAHCRELFDEDAIKKARKWKWIAFGTNIATVCASTATVIMASVILWQGYNMNKQTNILKETFELEKRPYVYVDITPTAHVDKDFNFYVGGRLSYKNEGVYPANIINTEVKVGSNFSDNDSDLKSIADWMTRKKGAYPYVNVVYPGQEIPDEGHTPHIGNIKQNIPRYIYVGVRIFYTGIGDKVYNCGLDYVYEVEKYDEANKILALATPLEKHYYWDIGKDVQPPPIKTPYWRKYK